MEPTPEMVMTIAKFAGPCCKLEKKRFDEISKKMKLKGAWKCTCGYRSNHGEKCDLFPPDRWPGGPKVSKKDYDWWLAHDHYRKP